jgi:hypothetical protein
MSLPVYVEEENGAFTAAVVGSPQLNATGSSRDAAIAALRKDLANKAMAGDIVFVDVEPKGLLALAGRYADDATAREMWDELVAEAYRYRDELKAQEFPE